MMANQINYMSVNVFQYRVASKMTLHLFKQRIRLKLETVCAVHSYTVEPHDSQI